MGLASGTDALQSNRDKPLLSNVQIHVMRLPTLFHWQSGGFLGRTALIMKRSSLLIACLFVFLSANLFAQGKIDLQTSDTILSILEKNTGQTVELRMKSGEKLGGKVDKVGDKLVHLSQLTGADFFDAAVDTSEIAAVIVRVRK